MPTLTRRRILIIAGAVIVLALVIYGFLPDPIPVETASVVRGALQQFVEEEGETQVTDKYTITSPVAAFVRRIELKAGDAIDAGQVVAELEPPRAPILDVRTREEAEARVSAAQAAVAQAEEQRRAAAAAAQLASDELERTERLAGDGSATQQRLDQATAEAQQATANLAAAEGAVSRAQAELDAALAALRGMSGNANLPVQEVLRSPVSGRVLAVHQESEGQVGPGAPLIDVGNTGKLEIRVEVLSQDAVRIEPGTPVLIEEWGGGSTLRAVVDRIEPQGFTDVSSLGVEEKRVGVIAALPESEEWDRLGSGFRVLARFIIWEGDNVLIVPTSALFRTEDGWAVFVVEDGTAVRREVVIGHQAGLQAEVLEGLAEDEEVILHPGNDISDGARVAPRRSDAPA